MGVEPTLSTWKADVLPLYDICTDVGETIAKKLPHGKFY